jgi:hypothetical protein
MALPREAGHGLLSVRLALLELSPAGSARSGSEISEQIGTALALAETGALW